MGVYQMIGKSYNETRRADPYIASRLSFHLQIRADSRYLDVACGTANYTQAMAAIGGTWHGLDESAIIIDQARHARNHGVALVIGKVDRLPYAADIDSGAMRKIIQNHLHDAGDYLFVVAEKR
jgi:ubiquinone/menaquinone biosynthesis C-methylase UbiE